MFGSNWDCAEKAVKHAMVAKLLRAAAENLTEKFIPYP
jgi:hypothetical protein